MKYVVLIMAVASSASATPSPASSLPSKQELARERISIAAWEPRWTVARRCLLGDDPLGEVEDAIAIATFTRHDCTEEIAAADDPSAASWPVLVGALRTLRSELAIDRRACGRYRKCPQADLVIAAAIRDVDDAIAALRARAGAPPRTITARLLPTLEPLQPSRGLDTFRSISHPRSWSEVHQIRVVTQDDKHATVLVANGPDRYVIADHEVTPSPDGAWAAIVDRDDVFAGPLDARHELASRVGVVATRGTHVIGLLGSAADRAVVFRGNNVVGVVRSHDAGRSWEDPEVILNEAPEIASSGPTGIDLYFSGKRSRWLHLASPTDVARVRDIADTVSNSQDGCMADGALWTVTGNDLAPLARTTATGSQLVTTPDPTLPRELLACSNDAVVIREDEHGGYGPSRFRRCTLRGCDAGWSDDLRPFIGLTATGVVGATQHGRVVRVQRSGEMPRFFGVPRDGDVGELVVWDDHVYLLVIARDGAFFVRVP